MQSNTGAAPESRNKERCFFGTVRNRANAAQCRGFVWRELEPELPWRSLRLLPHLGDEGCCEILSSTDRSRELLSDLLEAGELPARALRIQTPRACMRAPAELRRLDVAEGNERPGSCDCRSPTSVGWS
jgi:hypothetical protein